MSSRELQLLSALWIIGPVDGRQIFGYLDSLGVKIPKGTLYTQLRRLREKKFVAMTDDATDGRFRLFSITKQGTGYLRAAERMLRDLHKLSGNRLS